MPPEPVRRPDADFTPASGHGDQLMVFDVWDSIEELDAFTATQMPIPAGEHIDMAPPEPLEIHDLVDGSDSTALRTMIAELRDKAFFIRPIEKRPPRQGVAVGTCNQLSIEKGGAN